jgi:general stress protein YciG
MASTGNQQHGQSASGSDHPRARRGFAAMDGDLQRRIARKGGVASSRAQVRDSHGQFRGPSQGGSSGSH